MLEISITKPVQERSFSDSRIANQNDLNQLIVTLIRSHFYIIQIIKNYILYTNFSLMPKLKGKQIKDYIFGDCIVQFQQGSELAKAVKAGKMNLTVYGISNHHLDQTTFPLYNNEIAENSSKIYPAYYEIVRSQNFLYMIFQEIIKPKIDSTSTDQVKKFVSQIQRLFLSVQQKISIQQIFMKANGSNQLCIIVPYSKNIQKTSNLYSKYHNKSIFAQLFCQTVQTGNKQKAAQVIVENIEQNNLFEKLTPYLNLKQNIKISPQYTPMQPTWNNQSKPPNYSHQLNQQPNHQTNKTGFGYGQGSNKNAQNVQNKKSNEYVAKSTANKLIKQSEQQYPQIDQNQYEQLMKYVHVNPNLKKEAGNAYMRQSAQNRKDEAEKEIAEIVDNVNTSIFKITSYKSKDGKSTVQIKLNKKKLQVTQFEVHFEAHYAIFKLIKDTIRAHLQKYKNGFAGIIAAYLLTLIGILRRLRLYTDLEVGFDIYEIGGSVESMNFQKYTNIIKRDLAKQARNLVNLKNVIENANMPYSTYEALMPFLDQDLESINLQQTQRFCFFYMTVLMRKSKSRTYNDILILQMMYVLISPLYSIVFSQQDMPKQWDSKYFELKKVLLQAEVPQWQI